MPIFMDLRETKWCVCYRPALVILCPCHRPALFGNLLMNVLQTQLYGGHHVTTPGNRRPADRAVFAPRKLARSLSNHPRFRCCRTISAGQFASAAITFTLMPSV